MIEQTSNTVYRVIVIADASGTYAGNALEFPTVDEATAYARHLFMHWTAVRAWAVIPVTLAPDVQGSYWSLGRVEVNALARG